MPIARMRSTIGGAAIALTAVSVVARAGINLQPLLAVGGAGSIVLGLASQQMLANFAAGLTFLFALFPRLFFHRPFVPGEYVTLGSGVRGKVKSVRMMRTVIRTEDGALMSIPNKLMADMTITYR